MCLIGTRLEVIDRGGTYVQEEATSMGAGLSEHTRKSPGVLSEAFDNPRQSA